MASKLRITCSAITDGYPTMVEWYCNVVVMRRRQFFLFTHAPSLFWLWTPAAGSNRDGFGATFRRGIIDVLNGYGFSNGDAARIIDDGPDVFAKAVDRRVIGSMVDYAKMLRHAVEYEGGLEQLGSRAMNDIANECPMSMIGMESPADYLRQILRAETPHNIAVHRTERLRRQVETHVFFGFFARRFSFGWVPVIVIGLSIVAALAESWLILLGRTVTAGILLAIFIPLLRMPRYRQAAIGWWATKASIAIVAFIFLLVGGLVGFFQGQPEAIHFTLLALIWFPGPEFVPSLAQHQRFITVARILLSVPIVLLALQSGR